MQFQNEAAYLGAMIAQQREDARLAGLPPGYADDPDLRTGTLPPTHINGVPVAPGTVYDFDRSGEMSNWQWFKFVFAEEQAANVAASTQLLKGAGIGLAIGAGAYALLKLTVIGIAAWTAYKALKT